jgi:hypothetical protein
MRSEPLAGGRLVAFPGADGATMGQPVVHFEIIGKDAERLRAY